MDIRLPSSLHSDQYACALYSRGQDEASDYRGKDDGHIATVPIKNTRHGRTTAIGDHQH